MVSRCLVFSKNGTRRRLLKYCTFLGSVENKENAHVRKSTQDNGMKGSVTAQGSGFKSQLYAFLEGIEWPHKPN